MELYLLRHATAEPWAATDAARVLTHHGREQAKRVGAWCAAQQIAPELLLASPYARAQETAQLVATALQTEVTTASFLASGMRPEVAMEHLRDYSRFESLLLVGHEPDLSHLAAYLLGLPTSSTLHVTPATLIGLHVTSLLPGRARLNAFIPAPTL